MKLRKSLGLAGTMILAIIMSSCSLGATPAPTEDPGVIQTQAVSIVLTQVSMQQTQTALAIPPTPTNTPFPSPTFAPVGGVTNTPFAFNTQLPGLTPLASPFATIGIVSTVTTKNGCNDGTFMGESAPYDKDVVDAGKTFKKSWMILNAGTCTWDEGYSFAFLPELSSPELKGYSIVLKKDAPEEYTKPQSTQTFVVKLEAPKAAGEYKGYWKLKDELGNAFGPLVSVWITVK